MIGSMARYVTGDLYIKRITHGPAYTVGMTAMSFDDLIEGRVTAGGQRVWQYFDHVLSIVQGQKLNTVARIQSPEGMAPACFDDLLLGAEEDGGL